MLPAGSARLPDGRRDRRAGAVCRFPRGARDGGPLHPRRQGGARPGGGCRGPFRRARVLAAGGRGHALLRRRCGCGLLGASPEPGVLATVLHADPDGLERFWCEFPASRHLPSRMDIEAFRAGRHFYQLDAERMHPQAERVLPEVIGEALERAGVAREEVALFVLHYLDHRVARRAGHVAGIADDRIVATAEAAGHMAAAGIPIALADALAARRVRRGDVVCAAAFGGGMAWGATVLRL